MRRPGPHEELTDPENEKVLGTLTAEAWRGLSVEAITAKWYSLDLDVERLVQENVNPLELLIHEARQSSGSIRGEHRKDLKEAIIGAPVSTTSLSLPPATSQADASSEAPRARRGL